MEIISLVLSIVSLALAVVGLAATVMFQLGPPRGRGRHRKGGRHAK